MGSRNNPNVPYLTAITTPLACNTPGDGVRDPVVKSVWCAIVMGKKRQFKPCFKALCINNASSPAGIDVPTPNRVSNLRVVGSELRRNAISIDEI